MSECQQDDVIAELRGQFAELRHRIESLERWARDLSAPKATARENFRPLNADRGVALKRG